MQEVGNEFVVAFRRLVGDVEIDDAALGVGALAQEFDGCPVAFELRGDEFLLPVLGEDVRERHRGEQRDEALHDFAGRRAFDDQGEFHGGSGHAHGCLGALELCPIDDVGPVDQLFQRRGVHAEAGAGDVRDPGGAACVVRIEEVPQSLRTGRAVGIALACAEVGFIVGRREGGEVVIEPPGDPRQRRVLEVDDGVLAVRLRPVLFKYHPRFVRQAVIVKGGSRTDTFAMEAGEQ